MPTSVQSKDKEPFTSALVESQATSRPSSAEEVEDSLQLQHDAEKGTNPEQDTGKPFDARSTKTTESVIPPPPDGGLHAWLKVFGGFLIYVCSSRLESKNHTDTPTDQYLGLHSQLWRFPSVLQIRPSLVRIAVIDIVDRHRTSLAAHLLRRLVRPAVRSGLLPRHAHRGQFPGRLRHHDA